MIPDHSGADGAAAHHSEPTQSWDDLVKERDWLKAEYFRLKDENAKVNRGERSLRLNIADVIVASIVFWATGVMAFVVLLAIGFIHVY